MTQNPIKKKKKGLSIPVIISIIIGVIILASLAFIFRKKDESIEVKISKVGRQNITQIVSAVGKIQPEVEVKISSETSGELIELRVKDGDYVTIGQVLAKIKPDIIETQLEELRAQVDAAKMDIEFQKANVERAELDLKRKTELFKKEFISTQDFENAKISYDQSNSNLRSSISRLNQTNASLKRIERSAERTTITSPINGIVTTLLVQKGEKVLGTSSFQGTELMRIADLTIVNALVDVDENDVVNISVGDSAKVDVDAFPDKVFYGKVLEIGHSAKVKEANSQNEVTNFQVKIRLIDVDNKFRPGMNCNVDIETETHYNVISAPLQAVTVRSFDSKDQDKETDDFNASAKKEEKDTKKKEKPSSIVFVKNGNIVRIRKIELGISGKGFIEILKGVNEGEEIVSGNFTAVSKLLEDSSKVKLVDPKANSKGFGFSMGK